MCCSSTGSQLSIFPFQLNIQVLNFINYIRHYSINITLVRFSNNQIDTLPENIFKLPMLKELSISDNPVRHIPVNFSKC